MKQSSLRFFVFAFAAVGVLSFGTRADAGFVMILDDEVNPLIVINDNDMMLDTDPAVGSIVFIGPTAGFSNSVITGTSKPLIGVDPNVTRLDVSAQHVSSTGGTLHIGLSDDGFTLATIGGGTLSTAIGGTFSGAGAIGFASSLDFGPATGIGPIVGPPVAFAEMSSVPLFYAGGPFVMNSQLTIVLPGQTSASYNALAQASVVPEPATMAYLGLGLGALGLRRRRRRAA